MVKGISRNMSLEGKTKTLLVRLSFFVHFFAVLHDYDVNLPNFTLYGNVNKRRRNFISLSERGWGS